MTEIKPAVGLEDGLAAYQARETIETLAERLAVDDPVAIALQERAQAWGEHNQELARQEAQYQDFVGMRGLLNQRNGALAAKIAVSDAEQCQAILNAAAEGKVEFSRFLQPDGLDKHERTAILNVLSHLDREAGATRREQQRLDIESDRVRGEYFSALADFLHAEIVRKSAGAALFNSEIVIDPNSGRAGESRRLAAHHLTRYRENTTINK